jgi:hypothetical protein
MLNDEVLARKSGGHHEIGSDHPKHNRQSEGNNKDLILTFQQAIIVKAILEESRCRHRLYFPKIIKKYGFPYYKTRRFILKLATHHCATTHFPEFDELEKKPFFFELTPQGVVSLKTEMKEKISSIQL